MNGNIEAIEKHVVVIKQLATKTSFALEEGTLEQVFVSARLAKMFDINVNDHLKVLVTPNKVPENTTQWYAIYVEHTDEPEHPSTMYEPEQVEHAPIKQTELTSRQKFGDAILKYLRDGIDSAKNIGEYVGTDTTTATHALISLHKDGLVARASIRKNADQTRDSHVLWGVKTSDFLPED